MTETIQKADLKILHDFEDCIASIEQRLDSGLDQIVEQAAPIGMKIQLYLEDYICERLDELDKVVSQGKVKGPELLWRSMKPAEKISAIQMLLDEGCSGQEMADHFEITLSALKKKRIKRLGM